MAALAPACQRRLFTIAVSRPRPRPLLSRRCDIAPEPTQACETPHQRARADARISWQGRLIAQRHRIGHYLAMPDICASCRRRNRRPSAASGFGSTPNSRADVDLRSTALAVPSAVRCQGIGQAMLQSWSPSPADRKRRLAEEGGRCIVYQLSEQIAFSGGWRPSGPRRYEAATASQLQIWLRLSRNDRDRVSRDMSACWQQPFPTVDFSLSTLLSEASRAMLGITIAIQTS